MSATGSPTATPVWRGDWATSGDARVEGADEFLYPSVFIDAAHSASADAAQSGEVAVGLAEALDQIAGVMDEPLAAVGDDVLASPALRDQLSALFSTYRSDRT